MSDETLDAILRFHLVMDHSGRIMHLGPSLRGLLPETTIGHRLEELNVEGPPDLDLSQAPSDQWTNRFVHLRFPEPRFTLRGEFLHHDDGQWLFAAALDPRDADRIADLGLSPTDFAPSDMTMDFSMMKWTRESQVRETRLALLRLRRTLSEGDELRKLIDSDPLTGIANRNSFLETVDQASAATDASGGEMAVLMVDIDRFKTINDLYGSGTGDLVLKHVAAHLSWVAGSSGTVARLGADEFAVLVSRKQVPNELKIEVDQMCSDIVALNLDAAQIDDQQIPIRVSVGVVFKKGEDSAGELLRHADIALYTARQASAGPVAVFDPLAQHEVELRRALADELEAAIKDRTIELMFQPIVDLKTRRVVKFEVLSRWNHSRHGAVPPSLFFEVAEQCHLIQQLDRYVIERSLHVAAERLAIRGDVPVLSVNVSALSLTDDLVPFIQETMRVRHYPANRLCVEVTETSSITDMERTGRVLHDLDALGVTVSLDDFGTGFSSLTYLHQLPIGALKIDRSFVADMLTSRKALELVRSILNVASSLGLPVVAEGIETVEQCVMLQNLGCEQGQGYYFARPAPAENASATIGRQLPFGKSEIDPTLPDDPGDPVDRLLPSRALQLARDPRFA